MPEKLVRIINHQLQDPRLSLGFTQFLGRRVIIGPNEMTNPEFLEDLKAECEEDDGLLVCEGCPEADTAYIQDGVLFVVYGGHKYGVPLEDIVRITVIEKRTINFFLVNGSFSLLWMTQGEIEKYQDLRN